MMSNQNPIVIDVVPVHTNQPSVTSGTKRAENVEKLAIYNGFAVREKVRTLPKDEKTRIPAYIPLRWMISLKMTA